MNILNSKQSSPPRPRPRPRPPNSPQIILHRTFSNLQFHIDSTLSNLHNNAKYAVEAGLSTLLRFGGLGSKTSPPKQDTVWARIGESHGLTHTRTRSRGAGGLGMSNEVIERRLAGVPVYALCSSSSEFVLVTDERSGKSLGLFCIKEENADSLLQRMKSLEDVDVRPDTKVVPVSLGKVFQLKVDGVALRLLPEPSQVKNALEERQKAGISNVGFSGVPVFQSNNLTLKYQDKEYRPVFLRKEDLEKSLERAAQQQRNLNPAFFRKGSIEVAVLEDVIKGMKDDTSVQWNDVVFIPPGFDVSAGSSQL